MNKFKDSTLITIDFKELPGGDRDDYSVISLYVGHKGKTPRNYNGNETVSLAFFRSGKEWRFLNHHDLQIMCGEELASLSSPPTNLK